MGVVKLMSFWYQIRYVKLSQNMAIGAAFYTVYFETKEVLYLSCFISPFITIYSFWLSMYYKHVHF